VAPPRSPPPRAAPPPGPAAVRIPGTSPPGTGCLPVPEIVQTSPPVRRVTPGGTRGGRASATDSKPSVTIQETHGVMNPGRSVRAKPAACASRALRDPTRTDQPKPDTDDIGLRNREDEPRQPKTTRTSRNGPVLIPTGRDHPHIRQSTGPTTTAFGPEPLLIATWRLGTRSGGQGRNAMRLARAHGPRTAQPPIHGERARTHSHVAWHRAAPLAVHSGCTGLRSPIRYI
jgi:hypothetical protein